MLPLPAKTYIPVGPWLHGHSQGQLRVIFPKALARWRWAHLSSAMLRLAKSLVLLGCIVSVVVFAFVVVVVFAVVDVVVVGIPH